MNEIVKSESFEDKMKNRLKESIGDLITDEDLTKLVNKAVEEVFFTGGRKTISGGMYPTYKDIPPLLHGIVENALKEQIKQIAEVWVTENQLAITAMLDQIIKDGAATMMMEAFNNMFQGQLSNLKFNIENQIQNGNQY